MKTIIFDTETTGFNEPEVIEAAWMEIDAPHSLNTGESFYGRFKPTKRIELGALSTHHIMDEDLAECPPSESFSLPDGVEYLVGHNVDFDWRVMGEPGVKRICTLAMARNLLPNLDSHTQSALMYYFLRDQARERLRNAHSADADIENCLFILQCILIMAGLNTTKTTWEDVWAFSEKSRIPSIMTFGKHKGMAIKDIPADYKQWLLRQPDVDPYLIKALRGEQ